MTNVMNHREQRRAETLEKIYWAGMQLFGEKGYGNTTVYAIARRARIAQRTFFTYYASKKDILFAVPEEYCDILIDQMMNKSITTQTVPLFRSFLTNILTTPPPTYFVASDAQVYRIIFRSPELQDYVNAMKRRVIDAIAYAFAQDMRVTIDDYRAIIAAETLVNSFWIAGGALFPYERQYSQQSIDNYFHLLEDVLGVIREEIATD